MGREPDDSWVNPELGEELLNNLDGLYNGGIVNCYPGRIGSGCTSDCYFFIDEIEREGEAITSHIQQCGQKIENIYIIGTQESLKVFTGSKWRNYFRGVGDALKDLKIILLRDNNGLYSEPIFQR